jgi:hypothetical protein
MRGGHNGLGDNLKWSSPDGDGFGECAADINPDP